MKTTDRELWYLIARDTAPTIWQEAQRAVDLAIESASVEDSEPPQNFGFLKEPHEELYSAIWEGTRMRPEARKAILDHVNEALTKEGYPDAGRFINYSVYGSGASYNWDEDGDFDVQMWVDADKFNEGRGEPMTADDLVADIRRIVQTVNFPSCAELGLTNGTEGLMLIQYYAKPGTGSKDENLASKPYACFDLETAEWYEKPKPITPEFYGEWFILLEPKAKDIAMQASAVLESLERNVVEWSFWSQMYERHEDKRFQEQADQARDDAEMDRAGAHNLFLNIFQGRQEAYGPEGEGQNDERDLLQKLLEVWGIFQRLRHAVKESLPWEEQELPDEDQEDEHDSDQGKQSSNEDSHQDEHISVSSSHWTLARNPRRLAEVVHDILSSGGGTYNLDLSPVNFNSGYYSSVSGYEQTISMNDFGEGTLIAYLDTVEGHPDYLLGAWVEEGLVYLDLTKHIPDRSTAIEFGILNNQRAIWDIDKDVAIDLSQEEPPPAFSKVAAWKDLMEKAKRLKDQGRIHILNNQPDHVVGRVEGDHGTYTTQLWREDPNSRAITMWDCECPWDQYAWQRTRQWKKYEGRPCSHTLALFWTAQAQAPQVSPDQMQIPGMPVTTPTPPPPSPYAQGEPNVEGVGLPRSGEEPVLPRGPWEPTQQQPLQTPPVVPPGAPGTVPAAPMAPGAQIDPRVLRTAPGAPQQIDPRAAPPAAPGGNSKPQETGEGGAFGFPGALSSWHQSMADRSGNPEVDALIEDFLRTPQGEWTTDTNPIDALRDPAQAHGVCEMVTEQFVQFAKERGFKAYVTNTDLDEMGYQPSGDPQGDVLDEQGNTVPGFYPEHTVASIYLEGSRFPIVIDWTATQYGYTDHPKISNWKLRQAAFENGTIVRVEIPLVGIDRDGRQWRIPRNSKGEVLSSDDDQTIAIFPLSTGKLQPHLVRVVAETTAFSPSHGSPFIGR